MLKLVLTRFAIMITASLAPTLTWAQAAGDFHNVRPSSQPLERYANFAPGLHRGRAPATMAEVKSLKNLGIRTFINLASSTDIAWETKAASAVGIRVLNMPLPYFTQPEKWKMSRIEGWLNDKSLYPIYIHCKHGRDRTGLVVGLHRVLNEGWTPDEAYAEMRRFGFRPIFIGLSQYFEDATSSELEDGRAVLL